MRHLEKLLRCALVLAGLGAAASSAAPDSTFTNPIVAWGADPWIVHHEGWYYFTATAVDRIDIRKARTLAELGSAPAVTVWRPPESGPNSRSVWAPEFHRVGDRWMLYYTATSADGADANRRIFALESQTSDLQGSFTDRGRVSVPDDDEYAIDGTLHQRSDGALFFLWSGRARSSKGPQNIYIAPMSDPWTLSGPRVLLSTPQHDWEKHGWHVNEGPQVLEHGGRTFVVYSASGFTTPQYCLGLLISSDGDLLNPESWTKAPRPVFSAAGPVHGPGHNGFFVSPDGREHWIVYHARDTSEVRVAGRSVRAQPFTFDPDGAPRFGRPIPPGTPIRAPAGEPGKD